VTDLGEAKIAHYISETDFVRPFGIAKPLGEQDHFFPVLHTETERQLEKAWNADSSEEVVLMRYQSETDGYVKQLTKKSMMRDLQECDLQERIHPANRSVRASSPARRIFKFESRNPIWEQTFRKIQNFECNECGYGSAAFAHYAPNGILPTAVLALTGEDLVPYMVPAVTNQLRRLKMDVLQVLCDVLPDESLHALSAAYRPVQEFLGRSNFFRKRQLRCVYLATQFRQEANPEKQPDATNVMGLGIALDPRTNTLSSETLFDGFLSEAAFQSCGAKKTTRKKAISFHLPLAMETPHFQRIKPAVYDALISLHEEVTSNEQRRRAEREYSGGPVRTTKSTTTARSGAAPGYQRGASPVVSTRSAAQIEIESINVLYKLVNDLVVEFKVACDSTFDAPPASVRYDRSRRSSLLDDDDPFVPSLHHLAERFLPNYWQLFHLMLSLCRDNPKIAQTAYERVRQFIDHPDKRSKEYEPDLGELVVVAALVFACQDEGILIHNLNTRPIAPERINRRKSSQSPRPNQAAPAQANSSANHRNDPRGNHSSTNPAIPSQTSKTRQEEPYDPVIRWKENFAAPLFQEAMTRGVKQTLDGSPDLEWQENGPCEYRLAKSFQHCRSSIRLLALQINMFAIFSHYEHPRERGVNECMLAHLDSNFGGVPFGAVESLTDQVKAIFRVSSWFDFFVQVQYENGARWNTEELSQALRQCMLLSERRGYHINYYQTRDARESLSRKRDRIEQEWKHDLQRRLRQQR
jgi:hypothetical protein